MRAHEDTNQYWRGAAEDEDLFEALLQSKLGTSQDGLVHQEDVAELMNDTRGPKPGAGGPSNLQECLAAVARSQDLGCLMDADAQEMRLLHRLLQPQLFAVEQHQLLADVEPGSRQYLVDGFQDWANLKRGEHPSLFGLPSPNGAFQSHSPAGTSDCLTCSAAAMPSISKACHCPCHALVLNARNLPRLCCRPSFSPRLPGVRSPWIRQVDRHIDTEFAAIIPCALHVPVQR